MSGKRQSERLTGLNRSEHRRNHVSMETAMLAERPDNRIWLKLRVAGMSVDALVDTGATVSCMSQRLLDQLPKTAIRSVQSSRTKLSLANGDTVESRARTSVQIELGRTTLPISFVIMPKNTYDIILGMDALKQMNIVIDVGKREVRHAMKKDNPSTHLESVAAILTEEQKLDEFLRTEMGKFSRVRGRTSQVEHVIRIQPGTVPIKQRYYPCNPRKQQIIDQEVDKMLAEDIIEPSHSPWSSPVVLVQKKTGESRFCIDFRKVNAVTSKDSYPLPYISGILDKLRNSTYFSTLDLKHGYWQVPLAPASRPITAFTVPGKGLFQFKVLPFGLHSAGATFQRFLDSIIGPDLANIALVYLDDVVVLGRTFDEHLSNLHIVFSRLQEAGLQLQPAKCQFAKQSIKYLGHVVSASGIQTDPEKVAAISQISPPKSVKDVRSFLGAASWYRKFVPNFARITAPLVQLVKKNQRWFWGPEQDAAFQAVKDALRQSPVLICPDFSRPFQLHTDASEQGLGAVLIQEVDGMERAVAYASRTLHPAETKYSTTEKECLAVVWAIKKYRYYLEGYTFEVVTDHQCLRWLNELKNPSGRLARWAVDLQQFDFSVRYRSGSMNNLADSLSRNPLPCVVEENEEIFAVFQGNACPWYNKIYQAVTNSPSRYPEYLIHNEVLYRSFPGAHGETPWKLCIPKSERPRILKEIHDAPEAGHLGITKSIARAANRYYWPGMFREIRRYVQKCESCARHKFSQQKPFGQMLYSPVDCPWEQVSIDLMGPFPRSRKGFTYLLVLQDRFTKWTECQALRQATATAVVQVIKEKVIYRFGAPKRFICDNGSQFTSNQFRTAAKDWGVEIRFTAPYSPHQNPVERANRVIGPMLAQYIEDDQREWDVHLPQFMFAINTAKHETTGFWPAFLNFGRSLVPPSSLWREVHNSQDRPVPEAKDLVPELQKLRDFYQITKARLAEGFQRQRHGYNLRRRPFRPQIGQYVFKKEHVLSNAARNFSAKLAPKFSGPYKVIKTLSPNIVVLQVPGTRRMDRVHVKDLKLAPPESVAGPHTDTVPAT